MTLATKNSISVYFDTLGCAKNTVDTTKMQENLATYSISCTNDIDKSDCIVVNTCAFIESATQESINMILEYKKFFPEKKLIVVGCIVSRYKDELKDELHEVDLFLSCKEEDKLGDEILNMFGCSSGCLKVNTDNDQPSSAFEYVKISDGCNRYCSYCTIPYIRGKYKSTSYSQIKKDVNNAVDRGAKEIVLVAQDCGVWGSDLDEGLDLSYLLDQLANEFANTNFRILYVQPDAINDKLLNTIKSHENISNYLDIPLQHVSKKLLRSMNRKGDKDSFLLMLKKIRKILPKVCLRTTLISGYPGETENDFEDLCIFMQEAKFDYAGVFEYSQEEETKAAKLKNQVPSATKQKRCSLLRDLCDHISLQNLGLRIGKKYNVLIEGVEEDRVFGRAWFQAPDVDGYVYIDNLSCLNDKIHVGDIVKVKIVDCELYDLIGEIV